MVVVGDLGMFDTGRVAGAALRGHEIVSDHSWEEANALSHRVGPSEMRFWECLVSGKHINPYKVSEQSETLEKISKTCCERELKHFGRLMVHQFIWVRCGDFFSAWPVPGISGPQPNWIRSKAKMGNSRPVEAKKPWIFLVAKMPCIPISSLVTGNGENWLD